MSFRNKTHLTYGCYLSYQNGSMRTGLSNQVTCMRCLKHVLLQENFTANKGAKVVKKTKSFQYMVTNKDLVWVDDFKANSDSEAKKLVEKKTDEYKSSQVWDGSEPLLLFVLANSVSIKTKLEWGEG